MMSFSTLKFAPVYLLTSAALLFAGFIIYKLGIGNLSRGPSDFSVNTPNEFASLRHFIPTNNNEIHCGGQMYVLQKRIGKGSFGEVFRAVCVENNEAVAMKIELANAKLSLINNEAEIFQNLNGGNGIPYFKWSGTVGGYNILITELLGKSLQKLFNECGKKFSIKCVLMLADQMLERLQYVHSKNIIHRDIKPDNFIVGTGDKASVIFLIDFGVSVNFRNRNTGAHIPYEKTDLFIGSPRFASINTMRGMTQSRRDDLESLGYILVFFLKGNLPWTGLKRHEVAQLDSLKLVLEKKQSISADELCSNLPNEFKCYLNICRGLAFDEDPNYTHLKSLFKSVYQKHKYKPDGQFDWDLSKHKYSL